MRISSVRSEKDIASVLLGAGGTAAEMVNPQELEAAARAQREHERIQLVMNSGKEELKRSDLTFGRYHITHEPTGVWYRVFGGDPQYSPHIPAFFVTESGVPLLLERVGSQAEHEKQIEKRAERRAEREEAARTRRAQIRAQAR